ncbi:hypothetical protein LZ30DRAFT_190984 [Colletotrichum cereale]|nr:hypothetical protein LZ30DRAFT_190984 [Colletotrichum cereale]
MSVCECSCWTPSPLSHPCMYCTTSGVCKGGRETWGGQDQPLRLGPHTQPHVRPDQLVVCGSERQPTVEGLGVAYLATQVIYQGEGRRRPASIRECRAKHQTSRRAAATLLNCQTRLCPGGSLATINSITCPVSLFDADTNRTRRPIRIPAETHARADCPKC